MLTLEEVQDVIHRQQMGEYIFCEDPDSECPYMHNVTGCDYCAMRWVEEKLKDGQTRV